VTAPRPRVVTLYRRPGCSLCDEAERILAPLAKRLRFTVDPVDIECDEALHRRYMLEIPVVAVAGREVARAPLYGPALADLLAQALEDA
jgi:glutaredoxin